MEKKKNVVDVVWDLLEYLYLYGYNRANAEVSESKPFKVINEFTDLTREQQAEANKEIYKQFDNKDFRDRVNQYAELGNASDIIRVVETDGNRVYNAGGIGGASASGAKYKTWNTMEDPKVRDSHEPLAGIKVPIQDKFVTYDGDEAMLPGGFEDPANNVNCRCWLTFSK